MAVEFLGWELANWAYMILAAFAGGAFGASIGALPAFVFTGFMVIAGEAAAFVGSNTAFGAGLTGTIAFGPVFGPHIAFAGGVAAAAYAAKKGKIESGFAYHNAKDITYALGTDPKVLSVGGVFGILGLVIGRVSSQLALPWDPLAMGVVLSAVATRLVFRYPLIGSTRGKGLLDMSPFEEDEKRGDSDDSRLAVEPWLSQEYKWANVSIIGFAAGLLGGFIALATGSPFLAFGISAASLLFLELGVENFPVTHHMTLPSSTAALAVFGGVPATGTFNAVIALAVAGLFGIFGAVVGELVERIFYSHSDTHFDPPAAAIVVTTLAIAVLAITGVFAGASWVPVLGML